MRASLLIPLIGLSVGLLIAGNHYQNNTPKVYSITETYVSTEKETSPFTDVELKGEKLFKTKCYACHKIDKKHIGPGLSSALENWDGDTTALYLWVKNWQAAVDAGYPRAVEVQDYDPSAMSLFPELSNSDLDAIFAYIEKVS